MPDTPSTADTSKDGPAEQAHLQAGLRVGIIANLRSHGHREGRAGLDAVLGRHPDVAYAAPDDLAGLRVALRRFARAGVGLVVVNGGDGTVRDVLSALPEAYPGLWPCLSVLAAGNTNIAARAMGSAGRGARGLQRLLDAVRSGALRFRSCPVLQVSWVGEPERPVLRGFLLGAAAAVDGKRIADNRVHAKGLYRGMAVMAALALTVVRAFAGGTVRRAGVSMRVGLDGGPARPGRRALLLATTLDRLLYGIWPFWGAGDGSIRLLEIDAPARHLPRAVLAVLSRQVHRRSRSRARGWMAAEGYHSVRTSDIRLEIEGPFLLDGEHFEAGRNGVLVSARDSITFAYP